MNTAVPPPAPTAQLCILSLVSGSCPRPALAPAPLSQEYRSQERDQPSTLSSTITISGIASCAMGGSSNTFSLAVLS